VRAGLNVRTSIAISSRVIKAFRVGDVFDIDLNSFAIIQPGDGTNVVRVQLADGSGWVHYSAETIDSHLLTTYVSPLSRRVISVQALPTVRAGLNVRSSIAISSRVVKTFHVGDVFDIDLNSKTIIIPGDGTNVVRVQLADGSGWVHYSAETIASHMLTTYVSPL